MINQFRLFLGPDRIRALILLLLITGLGSFLLVFVEVEWSLAGQTALALIFLIGAAIIIGGRMSPFERGRWAGLLAPAVGALILGVLVLPHLLLPLAGAALGWVVAAALLFRPRVPNAYRDAIRHLRKGQYELGVDAMNKVIRDDPDNENNYRLRAEIFRVWGKPDRALRDYRQMTELAPDSAVAFNGLAEVYLQLGRFSEAYEAGLKAFSLAPDQWVAAYNLGLIADRLEDSANAITHLEGALKLRVPDARHRLLVHLYRARAHSRLGQMAEATRAVEALRRERGGLREWQQLLKEPEAKTLRAVLEADVLLADQLIEGATTVESLAERKRR